MKKIIKKISGAIQLILLAPVKLPGKVLNVIKYIGLGLGIIETVISDQDDPPSVMDDAAVSRRSIKYDLQTGKEVLDETE